MDPSTRGRGATEDREQWSRAVQAHFHGLDDLETAATARRREKRRKRPRRVAIERGALGGAGVAFFASQLEPLLEQVPPEFWTNWGPLVLFILWTLTRGVEGEMMDEGKE